MLLASTARNVASFCAKGILILENKLQVYESNLVWNEGRGWLLFSCENKSAPGVMKENISLYGLSDFQKVQRNKFYRFVNNVLGQQVKLCTTVFVVFI